MEPALSLGSVPFRTPLLLELDLTEVPVTPDPDDPLGRLRNRGRRQLRPTLKALYEAGDDSRVVGLITKVGGALPWATMQELRLGVQAFARSGKPTVAWAESFDDGSAMLTAYTLASAFGEIWLQPGGGIGPLGVGVETTFLRGALDKAGIEPQFEQRYEYKNAADRIQRTELTPAHRESLEQLTRSIYADAVQLIVAGRKLDQDTLTARMDASPYTAAEARDAGLVDRLGYRDEVYASVRSRFPTTPELLFADRWKPARRPSWPKRPRGHVALVEARGAIVSGRSRRSLGGRQVGSDTVSAQLRAVREDDRAKAVVLRVDSPGGSAVASEVIWREMVRIRDTGKPVVVSMGDVAASGGYYISCPADAILALPATLTGSIGVFGGKFVVAELLERLGLTTGTVQQGERALMYSGRRRFDEQEQARLAATIDAVYADFVAKVATGRGRPPEEIEAVARGRVWSGQDAEAAGLVDRLGGLQEALAEARTRGGLPDDAPVQPAARLPVLARLGRPRNSEDPRAVTASAWTGLADLPATLAELDGLALRMPAIRLR
ncbi:MAG TPA: signal peptide peptidase SppA [Propionibacteriaceae bacterium]|nr:signal peptide peptidase SppA [Propionibacteriaceae bacterium]